MDQVAFRGGGGLGEEIAASFSILAEVWTSRADLAGSDLLGSSAFLAVLRVFDFAFLGALGAARTDFLRSAAVARFAFEVVVAAFFGVSFVVALLAFGAGLARFDAAARLGLAVVAKDFLGVDLETVFLVGVFFVGLATLFLVAVVVGVRLAEVFALVAFADFVGLDFLAEGLRAVVFVVAALAALRGAAGFEEANSSLVSNAI